MFSGSGTAGPAEVHPGQHEAIIDQQAWDAVQAQLRCHARAGGSDVKNKWGVLLRGIAKCGVCGASLAHHYASRGAKRYSFYVCSRMQKEGATACPGSRISTRKLEEFVVERIRDIGKDPALIRETIAVAKREQEAKKPELIAELRRLDLEQRRLTSERANLLDAVANGGIGRSALLQKLGEVDEGIADTKRRTEELRQQLVSLETSVVDEADLRAALGAFDPVWAELVPRERARILQLLLDRVTYNGQNSDVELHFRTTGIRPLAAEAGKVSA